VSKPGVQLVPLPHYGQLQHKKMRSLQDGTVRKGMFVSSRLQRYEVLKLELSACSISVHLTD